MKKNFLCFGFIISVCLLCTGFNTNYLNASNYEVTNNILTISDNLTNLTSIGEVFYYNNKLYITDTTNNVIFQVGDITSIIYNSDIGIPSQICATADKIIFSKQNDFVYILNTNTNEIKQIDKYLKQNELLTYPNTYKLTSSANNKAYLISNNFIATIDDTLNHFCDLSYLGSSLNFDNGGFFVNEDNTSIYFSINNEIYVVNVETKEIQKANFKIPESVTEIQDFQIDNLDNLYLLNNNTLFKCTTSSYESVEIGIDANNFTLNFEKGEAYLYNNDNLYQTIIKSDTQNFITSYNQQPAPVDLNSISPKTDVVKIIVTNKTTSLYSFRSLSTQITTYEIGKHLILLDDSDEKFYYVYDNNINTEQKYLTGYILKSDCNITENQAPEFQNVKVIVDQTKLYNIPTSLKISNELYFPCITKVTRGTILQTISSPSLPVDSNGTNFTAVQYIQNDTPYICYIDSRTIIDTTQDNALDYVLVSNACTRAETIIYEDSELSIQSDILDKNTSITILETNNGICKIEYIVNGIVKYGYAKQSFIDDGHLTITQIIGIGLMATSLILAIIIAINITLRRKNKQNKPIN